jgi:hypothetical protein
MNLEFFKKNIPFTLVTICFGVWITLLIIGGVFASREVIFIDALPTSHVVSDYTSVIPLGRYFLEPFIGATFTVGEGYEIILSFVLIYAIVRVAYIILRETVLEKSEKFNHLINIVRTYFWLVFLVFIFLIAGIAIYLGIGYLVEGFLFINNNWISAILYGLIVAFIIILVILGIFIVKLVRPKSRLKLETVNRPKKIITKILLVSGREFRWFFIAFILFMGINVFSLSLNYPSQVIQTPLAADQYLFDFHVHTTMSDGFMQPEARVDWYISQGISGAFFTDHENQRGYQRAKAYVESNGLDFIVLPGQEYTYHALNIHLNIFGLNVSIIPPDKDFAGATNSSWFYYIMNVSDMIRYVKDVGGYVIVNHYTGPPGYPYTYEQLRDWGVDGFEIINSGYEMSSAIRTFCLANNLTCIAGSDQHTNNELDTVTKLQLTPLNDPTNITNIFENLNRNDHEAVSIHYPQKVSFPNTEGLLDFIQDLVNYYLNLDFFQVLSWILWSFGGYFLFVLIYLLLKRLNLSKLKEKIEYK